MLFGNWFQRVGAEMENALAQGFRQGAAKNGDLCGTMKVNCAAKNTNCVANCAVVNS